MKPSKLLVSFAAVLLCAVLLCAPAFAAVLQPTSQFYVNDSADVLTAATESDIVSKNASLYAACGAQIVVVTVQDTGGLGVEEYAYQLANNWGIGSAKKNNGVLLLLSIGEADYQCIQGKGLESQLTTATLSRILREKLEPDFAAGTYDAGVQKTFAELYSQVCAIYGVTPGAASGASGGASPDYSYTPQRTSEESGLGFGGIVGMLIFLVVVIAVISALSTAMRPRRSGRYRTYYDPGTPYYGGGFGSSFMGSMFGTMLGNLLSHRRRRPPFDDFGGPFGGGGGFHGGGGGFHGGGGGFGGGGSFGGGSFGGGGGSFRGGGAGRGH